MIYLVRHSKAGAREDWQGDDEVRPLTKAGRRQAEALAEQLAAFSVERVLSSRYIRCVETVEPLARRRGLEVEVAPELAEGAGGDAALQLIRRLTGIEAVLCSHGDVIHEVLERSVQGGVLRPAELNLLAKGSTWMLTEQEGRPVSARYLPPRGEKL